MLSHGAPRVRLARGRRLPVHGLLAAIVLGGCASAAIEPEVAAEVSGVEFVTDAPSCRYAGETVSFHRSMEGAAIVLGPDIARQRHDVELKRNARKLGANRVHIMYERNNGLLAVIRVSAFYAC